MPIFVAFILLCCMSIMQSYATTYTVRDFGIESDAFNFIRSKSLNQSGNVAGQYIKFTGEVCDFFNGDTGASDFYWNANSGLHVIPSKAKKFCSPFINNRDQVVGISSNQLYLYEPEKGIVHLGRPEGWSQVYIVAFDDLGQILISREPVVLGKTQFALWDQGRFVNLDLPGRPMDFNSFGDILLWDMQEKAALIYNLASKEKIMLGKDTCGFGINDKRHVVGYLEKDHKSFLWTPEKGMTILPFSRPGKLNNFDHMIGMYNINEPTLKPALWVNEQRIDLNQAADILNSPIKDSLNSPVKDLNYITHAIKINDKGQILAMADINGNGRLHIVLLDPQESVEKDKDL